VICGYTEMYSIHTCPIVYIRPMSLRSRSPWSEWHWASLWRAPVKAFKTPHVVYDIGCNGRMTSDIVAARTPSAIHQPDTIQRATTHCVCMYRHAPLTGRKQAVECTHAAYRTDCPQPNPILPRFNPLCFYFLSRPALEANLRFIDDARTVC